MSDIDFILNTDSSDNTNFIKTINNKYKYLSDLIKTNNQLNNELKKYINSPHKNKLKIKNILNQKKKFGKIKNNINFIKDVLYGGGTDEFYNLRPVMNLYEHIENLKKTYMSLIDEKLSDMHKASPIDQDSYDSLISAIETTKFNNNLQNAFTTEFNIVTNIDNFKYYNILPNDVKIDYDKGKHLMTSILIPHLLCFTLKDNQIISIKSSDLTSITPDSIDPKNKYIIQIFKNDELPTNKYKVFQITDISNPDDPSNYNNNGYIVSNMREIDISSSSPSYSNILEIDVHIDPYNRDDYLSNFYDYISTNLELMNYKINEIKDSGSTYDDSLIRSFKFNYYSYINGYTEVDYNDKIIEEIDLILWQKEITLTSGNISKIQYLITQINNLHQFCNLTNTRLTIEELIQKVTDIIEILFNQDIEEERRSKFSKKNIHLYENFMALINDIKQKRINSHGSIIYFKMYILIEFGNLFIYILNMTSYFFIISHNQQYYDIPITIDSKFDIKDAIDRLYKNNKVKYENIFIPLSAIKNFSKDEYENELDKCTFRNNLESNDIEDEPDEGLNARDWSRSRGGALTEDEKKYLTDIDHLSALHHNYLNVLNNLIVKLDEEQNIEFDPQYLTNIGNTNNLLFRYESSEKRKKKNGQEENVWVYFCNRNNKVEKGKQTIELLNSGVSVFLTLNKSNKLNFKYNIFKNPLFSKIDPADIDNNSHTVSEDLKSYNNIMNVGALQNKSIHYEENNDIEDKWVNENVWIPYKGRWGFNFPNPTESDAYNKLFFTAFKFSPSTPFKFRIEINQKLYIFNQTDYIGYVKWSKFNNYKYYDISNIKFVDEGRMKSVNDLVSEIDTTPDSSTNPQHWTVKNRAIIDKIKNKFPQILENVTALKYENLNFPYFYTIKELLENFPINKIEEIEVASMNNSNFVKPYDGNNYNDKLIPNPDDKYYDGKILRSLSEKRERQELLFKEGNNWKGILPEYVESLELNMENTILTDNDDGTTITVNKKKLLNSLYEIILYLINTSQTEKTSIIFKEKYLEHIDTQHVNSTLYLNDSELDSANIIINNNLYFVKSDDTIEKSYKTFEFKKIDKSQTDGSLIITEPPMSGYKLSQLLKIILGVINDSHPIKGTRIINITERIIKLILYGSIDSYTKKMQQPNEYDETIIEADGNIPLFYNRNNLHDTINDYHYRIWNSTYKNGEIDNIPYDSTNNYHDNIFLSKELDKYNMKEFSKSNSEMLKFIRHTSIRHFENTVLRRMNLHLKKLNNEITKKISDLSPPLKTIYFLKDKPREIRNRAYNLLNNKQNYVRYLMTEKIKKINLLQKYIYEQNINLKHITIIKSLLNITDHNTNDILQLWVNDSMSCFSKNTLDAMIENLKDVLKFNRKSKEDKIRISNNNNALINTFNDLNILFKQMLHLLEEIKKAFYEIQQFAKNPNEVHKFLKQSDKKDKVYINLFKLKYDERNIPYILKDESNNFVCKIEHLKNSYNINLSEFSEFISPSEEYSEEEEGDEDEEEDGATDTTSELTSSEDEDDDINKKVLVFSGTPNTSNKIFLDDETKDDIDEIKDDQYILIKLDGTPYVFKNMEGSDKLNDKAILYVARNNLESQDPIQTHYGFNWFHYLNVINKLLIIFVSSTSSKFRIYGVINNHYVQDEDKEYIKDVNKGITTSDISKLVNYTYRGDNMITGTLQYNHHISLNDYKFGRVYDIRYYLDDIFNFGNSPNYNIEAKDFNKSINSIMGYTNKYIVFDKKGTDESNKNIMKINLEVCKEMIEDNIRIPLIKTPKDIKKYRNPGEISIIFYQFDNELEYNAVKNIDPDFHLKDNNKLEVTSSSSSSIVLNRNNSFNLNDILYDSKTIQNLISDLRNQDYKFGDPIIIDNTGSTGTDASYFVIPNIVELKADKQQYKSKTSELDITATETKEVKFERLEYLDDPESLGSQMLLIQKMKLGIGVMLVTQGYSGTGKSFALFGSKVTNKKGIVESVLSRLNSKEFYIRIYEIYGLAMPYDFYFKENPQMILIDHQINDNLTYGTSNLIHKNEKISEYIDKFEVVNGYTKIKTENKEGEWDDLLKQIDGKRKSGYQLNGTTFKTIKETINNPESSRSIIYLDLKIKVDDKYVPLVVCDMPGRESLKESYKDHFKMMPSNFNLPKTLQKEIIQDHILEAFLWNPISLLIFKDVRHKIINILKANSDKEEVIDLFRNFVKNLCKPDELWKELTTNDYYLYQKLQFLQFFGFNENNLKPGIYSDNLPEFANNLKRNIETEMSNNEISNIIKKINIDNKFDKMLFNQPDYKDKSPFTFEILSIIYLYKEILQKNNFVLKFTIILEIVKTGIKVLTDRKYINRNYEDGEEEDNILKSFEGIFINENINAIMTTLLKEHKNSSNPKWIVDKTEDSVLKQHKQNSLDKIIRDYIYFIITKTNNIAIKPDNYTNPIIENQIFERYCTNINNFDYNSNNILYIGKSGDKTYDVYKNIYPSNKDDIITTVSPLLDKYLKLESDKYSKCSDFAFLLLTTNLQNAKKCNEQIKLLNNMKKFIEAVSQKD